MNLETIEKLVRAADALDAAGLYSDAEAITRVAKNIAAAQKTARIVTASTYSALQLRQRLMEIAMALDSDIQNKVPNDATQQGGNAILEKKKAAFKILIQVADGIKDNLAQEVSKNPNLVTNPLMTATMEQAFPAPAAVINNSGQEKMPLSSLQRSVDGFVEQTHPFNNFNPTVGFKPQYLIPGSHTDVYQSSNPDNEDGKVAEFIRGRLIAVQNIAKDNSPQIMETVAKINQEMAAYDVRRNKITTPGAGAPAPGAAGKKDAFTFNNGTTTEHADGSKTNNADGKPVSKTDDALTTKAMLTKMMQSAGKGKKPTYFASDNSAEFFIVYDQNYQPMGLLDKEASADNLTKSGLRSVSPQNSPQEKNFVLQHLNTLKSGAYIKYQLQHSQQQTGNQGGAQSDLDYMGMGDQRAHNPNRDPSYDPRYQNPQQQPAMYMGPGQQGVNPQAYNAYGYGQNPNPYGAGYNAQGWGVGAPSATAPQTGGAAGGVAVKNQDGSVGVDYTQNLINQQRRQYPSSSETDGYTTSSDKNDNVRTASKKENKPVSSAPTFASTLNLTGIELGQTTRKNRYLK